MGLDAPHLETHEARAFTELFRLAPSDLRQALGLEAFAIGSGRGVMTSAFDILAFNRVTATGIGEPVTPSTLTEIVNRYADAGIPRFFFQLAPQAEPAELADLLTSQGFSPYNNWTKLYRTVDDPPAADTDLQIRRIGPEHGDTFAGVLCRAFEWPESLQPVIAALVGKPGWTHYLAFDGQVPAATAAMYTDGAWCWIDFASTAADYRGRRAQSALICRRLCDAAGLGCRHVIVETAEDLPDKPGISCRNLQKLGFQIAYLRPNWLYQTGS